MEMERRIEEAIRPSHYNHGTMECIDAIVGAYGAEEAKVFCKINAFKYLWRLGHKDAEEQEIGKIKWYLDKYLELGNDAKPEGRLLDELAGFKAGDIVEYEDTFLSPVLGEKRYNTAEIDKIVDHGHGVFVFYFINALKYTFTDVSQITKAFKKLS